MKFYGDYREIAEKSGVQVEKRDTANIISFTPYIYNECSANCRFCSERLSRNGKAMICRNICGDYRERLKNVLDILSDRDVFLSLSGKEPTESPEILSRLDEREFILKSIVQGYYYYSFEYKYRGMKVCFEMSDYEEMEKRISENHLQKLILYPDGKLCMNWNMMNEVDINGIFENS